MKSIFGGLLDFEDDAKLEDFLEQIDAKTSIKIIENSLQYGLKNGIFSLEEAFCLYKCLTKVKKTINEIEAVPPF